MKGFRSLAIIMLLLSFSQVRLSARGQEAIDLSYADKLIEERQYNEAMAYLKEYMVKYPKYWEEAQKRVSRIIKKREAYNSLSEELIKLLQNDPANEARKIYLIKRLQDIEANPNLSQEEFLRRIEATAVFKVNQAAYEDIFKRGRELIDSGEYVKAVNAYSEGYVLYKEEFDAAGQNSMIVGTVNSGLEEIRRCLADFETLQQGIKASSALVEKSILTDGPAGLATVLDGNLAPFVSLIQTRNKIAARGRAFESQFAILQQADPNLTDTSFLPFAFRFTLGRKTHDENQHEGIMGAMDAELSASMGSFESKLGVAMDRDYEAMRDSFDAGKWDQCAKSAETVMGRSVQAVRVVSLWSLVAAQEAYPDVQDLGRKILTEKAALALGYQHMESAARIYAQAAGALKERERLALESKATASPVLATLSPFNSDKAIQASAAIQALRLKSAAQRALILSMEKDSLAIRSSFGEYGKAGRQGAVEPAGYSGRQAALDARLADAAATMRITEIEMARASASIDSGLIASGLNADEASIRRAGELISGAPSTDPEFQNRVIRDPLQSLSLASQLGKSLASKQADMKAILLKYSKLDSFILESASYKEWKVDAESITAKITGLIASAAEAARLAKTQAEQSDVARQEADRLMSEANANLKNENFDVAKDRLDRALARYEVSLNLQWDAKLKAESDKAYENLDGRIVTARRNKVVKDSRAFITKGTNAYYEGDFEGSEDYLVQAQTLWLTAYPEENYEVSLWLSRINDAVRFRSGRIIQPTAPLYSEMSQLLSQAKLSYDEGRVFLKSGKKTEALNAFRIAESKVQQVKIVFPNNQDASVLLLRIKLVVDPDIAERLSRQFFNDAQEKLKSKTKSSMEEGYNDLLTLKSVNPSHPGIDKAIVQAELMLGYRSPPAKAEDIAKSRELTASAKGIIDGRNKILYPDASNFLNQALKLWPDNTTAKALIDRLLQDGSVALPEGQGLTASDNVLYQKAVVYANKGQYLDARAIVDKLLVSARNKQNAQLLALRKKIEEALTR